MINFFTVHLKNDSIIYIYINLETCTLVVYYKLIDLLFGDDVFSFHAEIVENIDSKRKEGIEIYEIL